MVAPAPEPIAPYEPINVPELNTPAQTIEPPVSPTQIVPEPIPAPQPQVSPITPTQPVAPPAPAITEDVVIEDDIVSAPTSNLNTHQVKAAALRDLIPLLDRLNMTPSQRFSICRNIFEDLRDYTVLEQAYRAASEITNETERAEALLYLVESIDKM